MMYLRHFVWQLVLFTSTWLVASTTPTPQGQATTPTLGSHVDDVPRLVASAVDRLATGLGSLLTSNTEVPRYSALRKSRVPGASVHTDVGEALGRLQRALKGSGASISEWTKADDARISSLAAASTTRYRTQHKKALRAGRVLDAFVNSSRHRQAPFLLKLKELETTRRNLQAEVDQIKKARLTKLRQILEHNASESAERLKKLPNSSLPTANVSHPFVAKGRPEKTTMGKPVGQMEKQSKDPQVVHKVTKGGLLVAHKVAEEKAAADKATAAKVAAEKLTAEKAAAQKAAAEKAALQKVAAEKAALHKVAAEKAAADKAAAAKVAAEKLAAEKAAAEKAAAEKAALQKAAAKKAAAEKAASQKAAAEKAATEKGAAEKAAAAKAAAANVAAKKVAAEKVAAEKVAAEKAASQKAAAEKAAAEAAAAEAAEKAAAEKAAAEKAAAEAAEKAAAEKAVASQTLAINDAIKVSRPFAKWLEASPTVSPQDWMDALLPHSHPQSQALRAAPPVKNLAPHQGVGSSGVYSSESASVKVESKTRMPDIQADLRDYLSEPIELEHRHVNKKARVSLNKKNNGSGSSVAATDVSKHINSGASTAAADDGYTWKPKPVSMSANLQEYLVGGANPKRLQKHEEKHVEQTEAPNALVEKVAELDAMESVLKHN